MCMNLDPGTSCPLRTSHGTDTDSSEMGNFDAKH